MDLRKLNDKQRIQVLDFLMRTRANKISEETINEITKDSRLLTEY